MIELSVLVAFAVITLLAVSVAATIFNDWKNKEWSNDG